MKGSCGRDRMSCYSVPEASFSVNALHNDTCTVQRNMPCGTIPSFFFFFFSYLFAQAHGLTFLLHPLHGALYEESCFSMLEDLSTFFGSKGMRQSGQRGDVPCRHGCRQSPQKLWTHTDTNKLQIYFKVFSYYFFLIIIRLQFSVYITITYSFWKGIHNLHKQ